MSTYRHYISGFFSHRDQAETAYTQLMGSGIPRSRLQIFDSQSVAPTHRSTEGSNEVLKEVLVDGAVGTAVGMTIGGLAQVALVAANVTLFVASPLIAPLVMMGWGAGIGGILGASAGAAAKAKPLSELVNDAIKAGQIALVVETQSTEETAAAQAIFKELIGDYQDLAAARA
ncbi:hypothetical protein GCM10011613_11920 [Cellvibrio zantedeschiae]|uniref:DUF1269 domain-containing protein n=1 Tax=Cellvibrio zantedeschiae TaxID=1237077 RepID=A0ABQ3AXA2_9GAMM|nr:hypothetical protein [Cellvibrio zantedeschiae]GGY69223.1 hypothetical protein GCM10011613_11920 [Cellvibrio zantedeschiae]